jgi:hypothetical protein
MKLDSLFSFIAAAAAAVCLAGCGDDDPASPGAPEATAGTDGAVLALAAGDDFLYVGGAFERAGSAEAINVAKWDGADWSALGPGIEDTVRALAFYRGAPAAGVGGRASGARVGHVAVFEQNDWAWGLDTRPWYVTSLAVYRDSIIAGTSPGRPLTDNSFSPLVLYDGWTGARQPAWIRGSINSLGVFDDLLIVGGDFSEAGDRPAKRVARWDGSVWSGMDEGMLFVPRAFTVWNSVLVAGGGSGLVPAVSRWDGGEWHALGGAFDGPVHALIEFDGELIAAGDFAGIGGASTSNIARWDGIAWRELGGGADGPVRALALYRGTLIAGGDFDRAGDAEARNVAAWDGESWSALAP